MAATLTSRDERAIGGASTATRATVLSPPPAEAPARRKGGRRKRRERDEWDADEPPRRHGGDDSGDRGGGGGGGGDRGGDGPEPRGTPPGAADFAFGFLLVAVCTLFLAFLLAWALLRDSAAWPREAGVPAPAGLWLSTALLLASEWAMHRTARVQRGRVQRAEVQRAWIGRAALLGALFLAAQGWVWRELLAGGLTAGSNAYGAVFYSLTGLHALHVGGGIAYMLVLRGRLRRAEVSGATKPAGLGLCRVYWHLMGGLWILVFSLLYFGS